MGYGPTFRTRDFDYGKLRNDHALDHINPQGTCFALSCHWLQLVLLQPQRSPEQLCRELEQSLTSLAFFHSWHIGRIDGADQDSAPGVYIDSFAHLNLQCKTLNDGQQIDGASRLDKSGTKEDWMGCDPGDMWGVIGKYLLKVLDQPAAALLNCYPGPSKQQSTGGHAIAAYVDNNGIRVFDMNAGQFYLSDFDAWVAWSKSLDSFCSPGQYNFVDVYPMTQKG